MKRSAAADDRQDLCLSQGDGGRLFVIEAPSKEEAIRIASLHPAATLGEHIVWGIEVHPIGVCSIKLQK